MPKSKNSWFKIQAKADDTATIWLDDVVGWGESSVQEFVKAFNKIKDAKAISLLINSPGGSVFDGFAIYNHLKAHSSKITTEVMGLAASMASVIFMVGEKRIMRQGSQLMIHNPSSMVWGESEKLKKEAETLDKIKGDMVSIYTKSGLGEEEITALMDAETYFTAEEALEKGFATELEEGVSAVAASTDNEIFKPFVDKFNGLLKKSLPHNEEKVILTTKEVHAMDELKEKIKALEAQLANEVKEKEEAVAQAVEADRKRAKAISDRCQAVGMQAKASEWTEQGLNLDQVNALIVDALIANKDEVRVAPKVEAKKPEVVLPFAPEAEEKPSLLAQYQALCVAGKEKERSLFYKENRAEIVKLLEKEGV